MRDDWRVCCCIQYKTGELLDKKKPFTELHINAISAEDAVNEVKKMFNMCDVTVVGQPVHSFVTDEDYNKEK